MADWLADPQFCNALLVAGAMGASCSLLSVVVVVRRWAFLGEGIAHAGFGGAGTAWMVMILFPAATFLGSQAAIYAVATLFCLAMAAGVGWLSQRERVHADTAIGIFLVASLAWGFLAHGLYTAQFLRPPPAFGEMLGFEHLRLLSPQYVAAALVISAVVVGLLALLSKEVLAYSFDPTLAAMSGVRVKFIHYILILLLGVTIVVAMRLMGSVLVVALLVLPGATALLLSRGLGKVIAVSVVVGLVGALSGPIVSAVWPVIAEGPTIVLALVAQFAGAYVISSLLNRSQ